MERKKKKNKKANKPEIYNRIIIGRGTTAMTWLSLYPPKEGEKVAIVGMEDLWSRLPKDHSIGQPEQLIHIPGRKESVPKLKERKKKERKKKERDDSINKISRYCGEYEGYSTTKRFQDILKNIQKKIKGRNVTFISGLCEKLEKKPDEENWSCIINEITKKEDQTPVAKKIEIHGKNVICASGPGKERKSKNEQAVPAVKYLSGKVSRQIGTTAVVVEGGSATAAWCVLKALQSGLHVIWYTRHKNKITGKDLWKRFENAFPPYNYNYKKILKAKNEKGGSLVMCTANTQQKGIEIKERLGENGIPEDLLGKKIVKLSNKKSPDNLEDRINNNNILPFGGDILCIAAIGQEPAYDYLYKEEKLAVELTGWYDDNHYLNPKATALIGASKQGDDTLLLIGPGLTTLESLNKGGKKYTDVLSYLPPGARPDLGIPGIVVSLMALARYWTATYSDQKWSKDIWTTINLADFKTVDLNIAAWLAESLINKKLKKKLGRYIQGRFIEFLTDQIIGSRSMNSSPYGLWKGELVHLSNKVIAYANGREVDSEIIPLFMSWLSDSKPIIKNKL